MSTIKERSTRNVNLLDFREAGGCERVQSVNMKCPLDRQYILRMVVRADSGPYTIPPEINWVWPMFVVAEAHQAVSVGVNHPFCYITIRHGAVESKTDNEWHVDGFSTRVPHVPEQNYIWCSKYGTRYINTNAQFPSGFDPLRHNVNRFLQQQIVRLREQYDPMEYTDSCEDRVVYCLDPYILHRRPAGTTGKSRTFVRISFVPIEIDDVNNTQNPLLPRTYTKDGVKYRNTLTDFVPA